MSESNVIREEGRQNFALMPNIVDEMGLSVYAYRLYGHLKRVTGEYGICNQSTRTIAQVCAMSTASVSRAKQELIAAGLIRVREMKGQHGGHDYHEITIIDIWAKNYEHFQQRKQVTESNSQVSGSNLHVSPQKLASYCGAIKEESIKDLKNKEKGTPKPPEPPETPLDDFERIQREIERLTGVMFRGDTKDIEAINEMINAGVITEDIEAAVAYFRDEVHRPARGPAHILKSVMYHKSKRVQAEVQAPSRDRYGRPILTDEEKRANLLKEYPLFHVED